jgi:transposase
MGQRPRVRQIPAGAVGVIENEVARAKMRLGLPLEAAVISCYEAGRDGFWLHRYLVAHGITNHVVDSSSIEVNRRARRAKTDRLDLGGLLSLLARYVQGDRRVWRVVRVPTVAEEDARQLPRTWETLAEDRTRLINRLKGLLATQGVQVPIDKEFLDHLQAARVWDGTPGPAGLQERLAQDWAQLRQVEMQQRERKARAGRPPDAATPTGHAIEQLQTLRAIGVTGAWVLATEIFGWRQIKNRRQLGPGGAGPSAVSKWGDGVRPGHHARGEHARAPSHGAIGLGLAAVPTPQCPLAVVSATLWWRRETPTPHWDCRARAQTVNRPLALSGDRDCSRRRTAETDGGLMARRCGRA